MVRIQKFIKRLHSATGRCSPAPIFTGMYESYSIVFSNSAGSDVLQTETTTYTYNMGRIRLSCGCVSCDPGCKHWRIIINALKNLNSYRCWRCKFCPCNIRNKFLVNFWNRTIIFKHAVLISHWEIRQHFTVTNGDRLTLLRAWPYMRHTYYGTPSADTTKRCGWFIQQELCFKEQIAGLVERRL
jgi:hypothetical protein